MSTGDPARRNHFESKLITVSGRYMDKSGFSGSTLQTINGVFLLASFTALRIVFGGYVVRQRLRSDLM